MTISVVANQKGGVGKTLVTTGCAHAAAAAGKKVLVIDTDTQGSLTGQIADYTIDAPPPRSLADVLDRQTQTPLVEAVVASKRAGIDLLPSGFDGLQAVSDTLFGKPGAESSLARALAPVADRWDLVLIDTRPGTDLITRNAFMAADNIVMVLEPEVPAIRGGALTMRAIAELEEYLDKHLPVAGSSSAGETTPSGCRRSANSLPTTRYRCSAIRSRCPQIWRASPLWAWALTNTARRPRNFASRRRLSRRLSTESEPRWRCRHDQERHPKA